MRICARVNRNLLLIYGGSKPRFRAPIVAPKADTERQDPGTGPEKSENALLFGVHSLSMK
jgi:hypothetical protein